MVEANESRCTDRRNAPQKIEWAQIDGERLALNEFKKIVQETAGPHKGRQQQLLADLMAALRRVERCEVTDPRDIRRIQRCRDLWEIRINLSQWDLRLRVYVAEVQADQGRIFALLAHRKMVAGLTEDEIRAQQNQQIDVATRRWWAGYRDLWDTSETTGVDERL